MSRRLANWETRADKSRGFVARVEGQVEARGHTADEAKRRCDRDGYRKREAWITDERADPPRVVWRRRDGSWFREAERVEG